MILRQYISNFIDRILYSKQTHITSSEKTDPDSESHQFNDHLHSEKASENHIEDVHHVTKKFWLVIMLWNNPERMWFYILHLAPKS